MTPCAEMELLVQADLDGELTPAEAARVAAHLAGCAHCTQVQAGLMALKAEAQGADLHHAMPPGLEAKIRAQIRGMDAPATPSRWRDRGGVGMAAALRAPPVRDAASPTPFPPAGGWLHRWRRYASFGGGFALAACLALAILLPRPDPTEAEVVDSHIRALQPGHLMDVPSSDQHTVKPWFDGRIDFAPPVKNLAAARFPLLGGRLDYLGDHPVAALVYGRDKHLIDLFIWPTTQPRPPGSGLRAGYNVQHWSGGGMAFWAVSDLNAGELADFARLWQAP